MDKLEIIEARKALKMTQRELAKALCTTVVSVSRWEHGKAKPMKAYIQEIGRLLKKHGIEIRRRKEDADSTGVCGEPHDGSNISTDT